MSTNKTTNYSLNQWVKSDRVLMEDFNADNAKIDAALAALSSGKADKSALSSLQSVVDGKASTTALNSAQSTLNSKISGLQSTAASQGTALNLRNCRVYFATHTGDGGQAPTFTFPYRPWLVIFFREFYHGLVAVRGCNNIYVIGGESRDFNTTYRFSGNSLTFTNGAGHVNGKESVYTVLALLEL